MARPKSRKIFALLPGKTGGEATAPKLAEKSLHFLVILLLWG
jgi:hypothetical protein